MQRQRDAAIEQVSRQHRGKHKKRERNQASNGNSKKKKGGQMRRNTRKRGGVKPPVGRERADTRTPGTRWCVCVRVSGWWLVKSRVPPRPHTKKNPETPCDRQATKKPNKEHNQHETRSHSRARAGEMYGRYKKRKERGSTGAYAEAYRALLYRGWKWHLRRERERASAHTTRRWPAPAQKNDNRARGAFAQLEHFFKGDCVYVCVCVFGEGGA